MPEDNREKHYVTGIIEKTSEKDGDKGKLYGIKVKPKDKQGFWLNGFGSLPEECDEGNQVKAVFTMSSPDGVKIFRNIQNVELLDKSNFTQTKKQSENELQEIEDVHIRMKAGETMGHVYKGQVPADKDDFTLFMNRMEEIERYIKGERDIDE